MQPGGVCYVLTIVDCFTKKSWAYLLKSKSAKGVTKKRHFNEHGATPKAGEILLCGSHMPLYPMDHPGRVTMTVEGVGEISFRIG